MPKPKSKSNLAPATNLGAFKGGSLPNVSEQNRKQLSSNNKIQASDIASATNKKVLNSYSDSFIFCIYRTNYPLSMSLCRFVGFLFNSVRLIASLFHFHSYRRFYLFSSTLHVHSSERKLKFIFKFPL